MKTFLLILGGFFLGAFTLSAMLEYQDGAEDAQQDCFDHRELKCPRNTSEIAEAVNSLLAEENPFWRIGYLHEARKCR